MKLLIVSATAFEMSAAETAEGLPFENLQITRLVSGPGIMNTAFAMGRLLATEKFDLALNIGLAGSFHPELPPGAVVNVTRELISDLGAEDDQQFLTLTDMGLCGPDEFPYRGGMLINDNDIIDKMPAIPCVKGITVNTVHGSTESIRKVVGRFQPDVESMEGAAFFYACLSQQLPFLEIRAVSNRVEKRNRAAWLIPEAMAALKDKLGELLQFLNQQAKPMLSLGFSSCPNDTFIFEAMVNRRIPLGRNSFTFTIKDVEELNKLAGEGIPDITKVSFGAYLHLVHDYVLLNAGSALGRGCGPLLVAREPYAGDLSKLTVAIPGINTTANLLLGFAFPEIQQRQVMLFSEIEDSVLQQKTDLGLIIHESRFTYEKKGLVKIADLGEIWEQRTSSPIPLGGIIARRSLGDDKLKEISMLIKNSIEYAYANPEKGKEYIKSLAQETEDEIIQQHIGLYVNSYSLDLGDEGKSAVTGLFGYAVNSGIIPAMPEHIFLED